MRISFKRLEARLQQMVEGSTARLFPSSSYEQNFTTTLTNTIHANVWVNQDGISCVPNLYQIFISTTDLPEGSQLIGLNDSLLSLIQETGSEYGYIFSSQPVIQIQADPELNPGEIRIDVKNSLLELTPTSGLEIEMDNLEGQIPENAFLIVNGIEIFPLIKPVINIGRRPDNHLVIDDQRASRIHAQLRAYKGTYIIFDLGSSVGTRVNGAIIHQITLQAGDVIQIGSIPLVFGQDQSDDTGTFQRLFKSHE